MKNFIVANLLALGVFIAGCDTKGIPVEYSNACLPDNDGKNIEVGGFLDPGRSIFCSNTGGGPVKCHFLLKKAAGDATELSVYIVEGNSANNVEKPESGYKAIKRTRSRSTTTTGPQSASRRRFVLRARCE